MATSVFVVKIWRAPFKGADEQAEIGGVELDLGAAQRVGDRFIKKEIACEIEEWRPGEKEDRCSWIWEYDRWSIPQ